MSLRDPEPGGPIDLQADRQACRAPHPDRQGEAGAAAECCPEAVEQRIAGGGESLRAPRPRRSGVMRMSHCFEQRRCRKPTPHRVEPFSPVRQPRPRAVTARAPCLDQAATVAGTEPVSAGGRCVPGTVARAISAAMTRHWSVNEARSNVGGAGRSSGYGGPSRREKPRHGLDRPPAPTSIVGRLTKPAVRQRPMRRPERLRRRPSERGRRRPARTLKGSSAASATVAAEGADRIEARSGDGPARRRYRWARGRNSASGRRRRRRRPAG